MVKDNSLLASQVIRIRFCSLDNTNLNCHYLVVNDPIYAKLAVYSIASFLFHNRNFKVVIHSDAKCFRALLWRSRIFFGSKCKVLRVQNSSEDPMYQKALLLLQLQGTKDIFVDADTRFNGVLKGQDSITVLVREFRLEEQETWLYVSKLLEIDPTKSFMLNTSFFTWSGVHLNVTSDLFHDFYQKYLSLPWSDLSNLFLIQERSLTRLVEQFFFSILLSSHDVDFLKEHDKVADKGVIESTYYGASGYRFGR